MKLITLENLKSFWKDVKSYVDNGLSKKADSVHGTHVTYGTINGKAPGTPSAGTSSKVAREDHVHPVQTTVSGNAGSATKLATPRAINGTSFDGSANITTANWGTSRNITVGNTTKSVNGSDNVSWSLSEIGALPASGGAMTGNISFSNTGAASGTVRGITALNGDNDGWRIVGGQTASNAGYLEIATMDDNSEPIYVRQYTGAYTTLGRTATLLGSDGSTSFPVKVTSPSFVGALTGNASTATKATQDSAGQQINTTYIKGLSVSGKTITYTKGDGSTGTITTQDTNTTYSTGTASALGLTKLYTGTGTATDGTMTQAAIKTALDGKAASSHSHNYAGSNSAGGPANKVNLPRLTGSSNTPNYLPGSSTFEIKEFGNDCSNMPTAAWYHIFTGQGSDSNYNTQLALGMTNQAVFYRYRNSGTWGSWKQLAFTDSSITGNAGTATKLQTARSINGTNFDGTGNITTANWGTARNITIGNTAKSVNGSANVTWSLSEIGAAAASHTHNYVPTSDYSLTTISKTLTLTTSWQDTGITGSNLSTGTYIVQVSGMSAEATSLYQEIWSGTMSWFQGTTNSTDSDEIILHKAGHASNGRTIYLRTIRTSNSGYLKLQIASSHALSSSNITFKFRKLI